MEADASRVAAEMAGLRRRPAALATRGTSCGRILRKKYTYTPFIALFILKWDYATIKHANVSNKYKL